MGMLTFEFEELPLLIDLGFEAGPVYGSAEISFSRDGEWGIESIALDGHKKLYHTLEDRISAALAGKRLPPFEDKPVILEVGSPLHTIIYDRLDSDWRDAVQDRVNEQIAEDRQCAADDYADFKRDERKHMERV